MSRLLAAVAAVAAAFGVGWLVGYDAADQRGR